MPNYTNTLSAFDALGGSMLTTVRDIANISTEHFRPQQTEVETGSQGKGVHALYPPPDPGPAVITHFTEREGRIAQEQTAQGMRDASAAYNDSRSYEYGLNGQADSYAAWRAQEHRHFMDSFDVTFTEGGGNLPLEFANLAHIETAYSANAALIRTLDTMTGSLLNAIA